MEETQLPFIRIEVLLNEIRDLISSEIGNNPYEDLDKAIKIISQKNLNQFSSINNKLKNLSMMLYNRNLDCCKLIFEKLDEIHSLINKNPN
jgi:hypothetical protein